MAAPFTLCADDAEYRTKAREEIALIRGAGKGILRIGCVSSLLTSHFIDKLAAFHQRHPKIHLRIVDRIDSELFKLLRMHDIDIALCGPLPHDEKIVVRGKINWQDRICIVARQYHPLHQAAKPIPRGDAGLSVDHAAAVKYPDEHP